MSAEQNAQRMVASAMERTAHWISQVGSPPVLATIGVLLCSGVNPSARGWIYGGSYLALTIAVPCLYIMHLVRRGLVTDFHLQRREQRTRPLLLTLVLSVAAWLLLHIASAPTLLRMIAAVNAVQSMLFLGITLYWKVSLHCAVAAGLGVILLYVAGGAASPLLVGVAAIAWSRVYLGKHTMNQTIAGAALGAMLVAAALFVL